MLSAAQPICREDKILPGQLMARGKDFITDIGACFAEYTAQSVACFGGHDRVFAAVQDEHGHAFEPHTGSS
jgi:hypothetical protein